MFPTINKFAVKHAAQVARKDENVDSTLYVKERRTCYGVPDNASARIDNRLIHGQVATSERHPWN